MDLPKRKKIRLENYCYSNGGSYFLTICTKDREKILSRIEPGKEGDYPYNEDGQYLRVVLTEYGKIAEEILKNSNKCQSIQIEHYIIMPDHIHFVISVIGEEWSEKTKGKEKHEQISKFLSTFKTLCRKKSERLHFQRTAYDHIIRNAQDYEQVVHYIHQNPARWYFREHHGKEE